MNNRFKQIRKEKEFNQEAFGKELGVTKSAISSIESGRYKLSEPLIKIACSRFGVNENWLRTGNGEMFDPAQGDMEFERVWRQIKLSNTENADFIKRIMRSFWNLSEDKQAAVRELIEGIPKK